MAIQKAFIVWKIQFVFDTEHCQLIREKDQSFTAVLTTEDIEALLPVARQYWLDAGAVASVLDLVQFKVAELDANAAAIIRGAQVTLDASGAGHGWL